LGELRREKYRRPEVAEQHRRMVSKAIESPVEKVNRVVF
jgi:hypothetical protein